MRKKQHLGISINSNLNKEAFLQHIFGGGNIGELTQFNDQNGALFSDLAIAEIHEEERRYDKCLITDRKLTTFSSGERKKIYIDFILKDNPDFIVLDNPLDHLDQESRVAIAERLDEIAKTKTIIQLANRASDFLPFIKNEFILEENPFRLNPISKVQESDNWSKKQLNLPKNGQNEPKNDYELIKMENLTVHYDGRPIIKDICWTIRSGDFWQLVGPNGSGKSTILSLITGESTKGYGQELYLFGRKKGSGESIWEIKQKIGFFAPNMTELFQRNNTLLEMILSGYYDSIGLYDTPSTLQRKESTEWLKLADLLALKNTNFNKLSAGQQRLGLILRAVVKNPPLLILDEPTEGLDEAGAQLVIDLVNMLHERSRLAIVFVSHRLEKGLEPKAIFELTPSLAGSTGKTIIKGENWS